MTQLRRGALLTIAVVAWTAAPAEAQWVVTPYLGINLAGDVEFRRGGPGVSVKYFGGWLGFEFDVERYNHFFKDSDVGKLVPSNCGIAPAGDPCNDLNTDAMSFMGNVVVPIRLKGATNWRPYTTAGLGAIRAWVEDPSHQLADTDQNNLAFNVGGGVMYSPNQRVGLRLDLRYFHALVDDNANEGVLFKDYGFLRATFGVTFGFPRSLSTKP